LVLFAHKSEQKFEAFLGHLMTLPNRLRQLAPAITMAGLLLALGACGGEYPNSTFNHHTEVNTWTDGLWDTLLLWGTIVFVIVEVLLLYIVFRFRKREGGPAPVMTHGNTAMELTWTVLPIIILVIIAVPTVKTIFRTQAAPPSGSLEIEVVGHQWWWEYKYPQYGFSTANEFYIPVGRTAHFTLRTFDVLHSFWVPQMGGKRDLISNRTNHIWYTPNVEVADSVWNGFCTEYCGASHANMRIRAYTVTPEHFEQWVAGQKAPPAFTPAPPAAPPAAKGMASAAAPAGGATISSAGLLADQSSAQATPAQSAPPPAPAPVAGWIFPRENLPSYSVPKTPIPRGLAFDDALLANGDVARGQALFVSAKGQCAGCHMTTPVMFALSGPNLAHIGSRHTIGAGLFPNDDQHLARWIKNARRMKPGVAMYTLGANEIDPQTKMVGQFAKLTDAEIADIVAYLRALR
jgi:cytochrome c oxidase subunit 2